MPESEIKEKLKSAFYEKGTPSHKNYIAVLLVVIAVIAVAYLIQSGFIQIGGAKISSSADVSSAVSQLGSGLQNASTTLDEIAGSIG